MSAGGVGGCFLSPSGECASEQREGRLMTKWGQEGIWTGKGGVIGLSENTASSKVVTQSVQQRKLTADSSSRGGSRSRVALSPSGEEGECLLPCSGNPVLPPPIPTLSSQTRGREGARHCWEDALGSHTWLQRMRTHTHTLQTSHAPRSCMHTQSLTLSHPYSPLTFSLLLTPATQTHTQTLEGVCLPK